MTAPDNSDIVKIDNIQFATRDLRDSQEEAQVQPAFVIIFGKGQPLEERGVLEVLVEAARVIRGALNDMIVAYLDPENTFPC